MRRRTLVALIGLTACRWEVVLGADGITLAAADAAVRDATAIDVLVAPRDVPGDVAIVRDAGASDLATVADVGHDVGEDIPETPAGTLRAVVLGGDFSCAVRSDDSVWCWGDNAHGELGVGTTAAFPRPVRVRGLGAAVSVVAGSRHACALLRAGGLRCWGANDHGQLGDGTTADRASPVTPTGLDAVAEVTAAGAHTCARAGTVVSCAGDNRRGQLGDGTTLDRSGFAPVAGAYRRVLAGGDFTAAETTVGGVQTWGANDRGQLGDGTTLDRTTPVAVMGVGPWSLLAVGGAHAFARAADGTTYGWGDGARGALGDGATLVRPAPVVVPAWRELSSFVAGDGFTCGVLGGGTVYCAGVNERGELGDGTGVDNPVPQRITELARVVLTALAAGPRRTCAILTDTTLWCWGDNALGQLDPSRPPQLLRPLLVTP